MRSIVVVLALLLAGCSSVEIPTEPPPVSAPDVSVRTDSAPALALSAVTAYVERLNAIEAGDSPPESIAEVTSGPWSVEEIAGFAAASVIDAQSPPRIDVGRIEIARVRGRAVVVDVLMHVCFVANDTSTLTSVRLVPRTGTLVVDEIRPWEDSTWCVPSSQF